jgi:hypothetical protein
LGTFTLLIPIRVFCQNDICTSVFQTRNIVYFGVDFSKVKFININSYGFSDLKKIKDYSLGEINNFFLDQYELDKMKDFYFAKEKVLPYLNIVDARNATLITDSILVKEEQTLILDTIKSVISRYSCDIPNQQLGFVIIAENLVKYKEENVDKSYGTYWAVFFDISKRTILIAEKMKGKSCGVGWEKFWICSIQNILADIDMKKLKKKYCGSSENK